MFTNREKEFIENGYFTIIRRTDRYIEFFSNNTKHQWIIFKNSLYSKKSVTVYHKHTAETKYYHKHYETKDVKRAVANIKGHDEYVLKENRGKIYGL